MHDIRAIRDDPEGFDHGLNRRGLEALSGQVLEIDGKRRAAQTVLQDMLNRRNEASRQIGSAKQKGEDAATLVAEVQGLKDDIAKAEAKERALASELDALLAGLPNQPAPDVPDGEDERANALLREVGEKPSFGFTPKQHYELGEGLGLMDFETAAKLSGARFVVLKGALARLERALAAFMLDLHISEFGYTEIAPPVMVRDETMYGTGQLPKFADDLFRTAKIDLDKVRERALDTIQQLRLRSKEEYSEEDFDILVPQLIAEDVGKEIYRENLWLIPTAEVPLTALAADTILNAADLPIRVTAHTPCFRSEAGAAGKDTRGMIRQHQFNKVELVSITHADESDAELERMTACAEEVLKRLGLAYRVVTLCTGDMGFGARKTYDIEVWLPGQDTYREISSCSNCWDFQARRMGGRFRTPGEKGTRFVHTLNGSGLAVGRTLIAVLENYQQEDGSIVLPEALLPYMNGCGRIANDAAA